MLNSFFLLSVFCFLSCGQSSEEIAIAVNGKSKYSIVIPVQSLPAEKKAAAQLQHYLQKVTGALLPIKVESAETFFDGHNIYLGYTNEGYRYVSKKKNDGFTTASDKKNIFIVGHGGQGTLYGVYDFLEQFAGCSKQDEGDVVFKPMKRLYFPKDYNKVQHPSFQYREVYYPPSFNDEYLAWHKLQRLEDLWGIWGHSFFKLVPPEHYFAKAPEFFSLVNGRRQPMQLCLSNNEMFEVMVKALEQQMKQKDYALYWSISANDDIGYCTCNYCAAADAAEGSHAGSLIRFVNKIAKRFPDKIFTTLAYQHTAKPPKTKPADNVYVMLSTIDAYRTQPLEKEKSAATFNSYLKGWQQLTTRLFIWDYTTQFTNYLAPFPQLHTFPANVRWFKNHQVKGVFEQGSGDAESDFSELYSFVLSKLLWNTSADADSLTKLFCNQYYTTAAPYILSYLRARQDAVAKSKAQLDIYGNPVNSYNDFLSPENIDLFSSYLDKAEAASEADAVVYRRVQKLRLALEYTVLQQSKFFGKQKFGFEVVNEDGSVSVKAGWPQRLLRFKNALSNFKIDVLNEDGLTAEQYFSDWNKILSTPHQFNLAYLKEVKLAHPFAPEYPARREQTLVDEVIGYNDFSFNWLLFYGNDLDATIDLGAVTPIKEVKTHFLKDAKHWIFLPVNITVFGSDDGLTFQKLAATDLPPYAEDFDISVVPFQFAIKPAKLRYIRVVAETPKTLPPWRTKENRRPSIACDEIFVR